MALPMKPDWRRLADGLLFQAVLEGSLSFTHIHDVAAHYGQSGWVAWAYPLSVDLFTVTGYRKIRAHGLGEQVPAVLAWIAFTLGLSVSIAANVLSCWHDANRPIAVAIGVWPAVAFLLCTLLSHSPAAPAETVVQEAVAAAPPLVQVAAVPQPPTVVPVPVPVLAAPPALNVKPLTPAQKRKLELVEKFIEVHGEPELRRRGGVKKLAAFVNQHLKDQGQNEISYPQVSKALSLFDERRVATP